MADAVIRAADDVEAIYPQIKRLELNRRRQCLVRHGLGSAGCWCIGAAEDGRNVPCPTPENAPGAQPCASPDYSECYGDCG